MRKWRILIIIISLTIVLAVVSAFGWLNYPKSWFWKTLQPARVVAQFSFGKIPNFFRDLFHLSTIIGQNKSLQEENLNLQSKLSKLQEVEYENEILKKELSFSRSEDSSQMIAAAIIGQPPSGYLRTLLIDKGESNAISKGQAVISQGFLVGKVTKVYPSTSEITLITDFNSLIPVVLQNSRGTGLLRGGLDGLVIESIPLNIQTEPQENVITSGLGGEIPAGIAVGKLKKVISKEGEIFQKVLVASPVDFSRLEVLFILKRNE